MAIDAVAIKSALIFINNIYYPIIFLATMSAFFAYLLYSPLLLMTKYVPGNRTDMFHERDVDAAVIGQMLLDDVVNFLGLPINTSHDQCQTTRGSRDFPAIDCNSL